MLPVLFALVLSNERASTPQAQAIQIVSVGQKSPAVIRRVNVAGRYATVLTSGGIMEGWQVTAPILFEHFSFGWQALDVLNFQCRLDAHNLGPDIDAALMRGMPKPQDDRPCSDVHDAGPRAQVESVRALMREPLVPYVIVRDGWAMGEWYGGGGGESLYKWQHGRWFFIAGGGGAMGVEEMREYGVPQANWCTFGIYNAKCH